MRIEKICLCSSRHFFDELKNVKGELERLGYTVLLPSMENIQDEFIAEQKEEGEFAKIHYDLIRKHFKKIEESDAILICNFDKNGIEGYIGGNSFLEMGKAFDSNKPIFLTNPVPQIPYRPEILAMQPTVLTCLDEMGGYSR